MRVRAANTDDAAQVAAILNEVIRDTTVSFKPAELSQNDVRAQIAGAPGFFVAVDSGGIIGFASYDQFRKGAGYARTMEHTVMLAPNARGQGVGRALMAAVEDHARAAGIGSLWAGISRENPDAISFHLAMGFEEVAQLPKVGFKFGRWLDLVLMRKWLQPERDGSDRIV